MSGALPYTGGTCIPLLLADRNYLDYYFYMYKRLMRFRLCAELVSPAYLGLGII